MSRMTYEEMKFKKNKRAKTKNDATKERRNHKLRWTSIDDAIVSNPNLSVNEKAKILERSIYAVNSRMYKLKITNKHQSWTDEEIDAVKDLSLSKIEVAELLGRSVYSVSTMRQVLKMKGELDDKNTRHMYTPEDDNFVASHTVEESADFLGVTVKSVTRRRSRLIINGKMRRNANRSFRKGTPYTNEELEIITDLSLSNKECAELLDRSVSAICCKRCDLRKKGLLPPSN